jgi:SAM-dependent methyltransferase
MSRTLFDSAAQVYDRLRPPYPPGLYDGIEELSGRPLRDAVVADVGAGTGIATAELVARGAHVLAVDLSLAMLKHQRIPSAAVVGSGAALPVRSASCDLVCYAMSWHWMPEEAASAEASRVLRAGRALALWWNEYEEGSPVDSRQWFEETGRKRPANAGNIDHADVERRLRTSGRFTDVWRLTVPWQRSVDIQDVLDERATHSSVIELGVDRLDYLLHYRAQLDKAWPDGIVHERYVCQLHVALVA